MKVAVYPAGSVSMVWARKVARAIEGVKEVTLTIPQTAIDRQVLRAWHTQQIGPTAKQRNAKANQRRRGLGQRGRVWKG